MTQNARGKRVVDNPGAKFQVYLHKFITQFRWGSRIKVLSHVSSRGPYSSGLREV